MLKSISKIFFILLFLILIVLILIQFFGVVWEKEVLYKNIQPINVKYESHDPYMLRIIKLQYTFNHDYIILVSSKNNPDYGHVLMYPGKNILGQFELDNIKIDWTQDGIDLELYLNTRIFIPKKNFTKGR